MSRRRVTGPRAKRRTCVALAFSSVLLLPQARAQAGNVSEQYLFQAANRERAEYGLAPLRYDPRLFRAAFAHARMMAQRQTISHQFSGEPDLAMRASNAGARFSVVTENVAEAGNAALIHDLWMRSQGHRENLLDAKVDSIGISVIAERGQLYAVEDFARTVERLSLPEQESRVSDLLADRGLALLAETHDAERTCTMSTGYAGQRQPWFVMRFTAASLDRLPDELREKLASGRYRQAAVGACEPEHDSPFTSYQVAVLLYP